MKLVCTEKKGKDSARLVGTLISWGLRQLLAAERRKVLDLHWYSSYRADIICFFRLLHSSYRSNVEIYSGHYDIAVYLVLYWRGSHFLWLHNYKIWNIRYRNNSRFLCLMSITCISARYFFLMRGNINFAVYSLVNYKQLLYIFASYSRNIFCASRTASLRGEHFSLTPFFFFLILLSCPFSLDRHWLTISTSRSYTTARRV